MTIAQHQPNNLQKPKTKCPKNMKLPRSVKRQAASQMYTTAEQRNHYMRSTGIAIHEAASKIKNAARAAQNRTSTSAARAVAEAPTEEATV